MVVLFLVFEVQSKSLSLVQDCIVGHMVQVWDHQVVHHIEDQVLDHRIVDQVQKIFHPIQVILDTLVWVREDLHMDQDILDLEMA